MDEALTRRRPWTRQKTVIGMIHLLPLPGSPRYDGDFERVTERARLDLRNLGAGGIHGVIVENYGDAPFYPEAVPAITVAAMSHLATVLRREAGALPMGINVLRNDAAAALAVAAACGAAFVRINVHCGAMLTDQGIISGRAHDTLRLRETWCPGVAIAADVHVKHAVPLAPWDLTAAAADTWHRGLADALIITGTGTGRPVDKGALAAVRQALPEAFLIAGSGVDAESITGILTHCDAVIAGTALKMDGRTTGPVDTGRVRRLITIMEETYGHDTP